MYSEKLKEYQEDDFLMLSGIQHFIFCRRQWALIHIEQQWAENFYTVDGEFFHGKAHDAEKRERRDGNILSRGMKIFSRQLGISGNCDVVEFRPDEKGISLVGETGTYQPVPIEYKRGKPKAHDADEIQLCAQAMCLEEMLLCQISSGYLFYGETRRRKQVDFSEEMRNRVTELVDEMHSYYERGYTPKVKKSKGCQACSLKDVCIPRLEKTPSVGTYLARFLNEKEE